ncbi:MAG: SAVED domain-containing protein [Thermoanaerobaculia bacterium]
MDYQDFTVDIRSANSGGFEATVVTAPIRRAPRVFFPEPIERETLSTLFGFFDGSDAQAQRETPAKLSPRRLGQTLYSAVLKDQVGDLFRECRTAMPRDGRLGLRLRLRFLIDDPEAEYLAALPWEWLWDPQSAGPLAARLRTPIVRDLAAAQPLGALDVGSHLRILVVDAAPGTMEELSLKLEIERMTEALAVLVDAGWVELVRLVDTTPESLRDVLLDDEIHVLHFMGHGGYDPGSGFGALFFAKRDGKKDQVSGTLLATYLKDIPSLRLVVLNSCKTARYAGRLGLYEGVASAVLAGSGIPAVVANQYTISDSAAISFSETFYGRIAAGDGVDAALTETRLRLHARSAEWATPVLFMSAPDGKLFTMEPVGHERTVRLGRSQPEASPLRLGVRSILGWGRDMETRNDAVLDLTQCFDDRYIKEKPWWQERVFPELRDFLLARIEERRPLLLDFAAHSSIAFAAGWLLEPKSGLDVRVRQRTGSEGEFEWSPKDGKDVEGPLWLDRPDVEIDPDATDVALALSVSQPDVAAHVEAFVRAQGCPVRRILDAVIAPEPGGRSVLGGTHALRLAHALLPRLRRDLPQESGGSVHVFCAAPNALTFYLGQLSSSLPGVILYEFPFKATDAFGRYQRSIELPPPEERRSVPKGW